MATVALALAGCAQNVIPTPLTVDTSTPTGVARDFVAVYESRDGTLTSTTEIAQSGTGVVLRKKSDTGSITCNNLTGKLACKNGSGTLLATDDAAKALRIEALTTQRLLGGQRVLGDEVTATAKQIPSNLYLFKKDGFTVALTPYAGTQPESTLNSCYDRTTTEEKEFFCFGADLMPYWADTTFTPIGNVTLTRSLKAYSATSLTAQQMQELEKVLEK